MCENNDPYRRWLWVGREDQKKERGPTNSTKSSPIDLCNDGQKTFLGFYFFLELPCKAYRKCLCSPSSCFVIFSIFIRYKFLFLLFYVFIWYVICYKNIILSSFHKNAFHIIEKPFNFIYIFWLMISLKVVDNAVAVDNDLSELENYSCSCDSPIAWNYVSVIARLLYIY